MACVKQNKIAQLEQGYCLAGLRNTTYEHSKLSIYVIHGPVDVLRFHI
jgi:hypothetical protein